MHKKLIKLFFIFYLFFLFLPFSFAFAQERILELEYPTILGISLDTVNTQLEEYVLYIFSLSVVISGLFLFGTLVYGGIKYITSYGNVPGMIDARQQVLGGFFGILIILSSYIILTSISPELRVLDIEVPEITFFTREKVERPEDKYKTSSIDVELPLGRIIMEGIFPEERMDRIEENTSSTLSIALQIEENNDGELGLGGLWNAIQPCDCSYTTCECDCPFDGSGCPVPDYCYCDCDPCDPVRNEIEFYQQENVRLSTLLEAELKITTLEIQDLRNELNRLNRLEKYFVEDCRLWTLQSLNEFLIKTSDYSVIDGEITTVKAWEDISTIYESQIEGKIIRDWATFYCQVGGKTFFEQPEQPDLEGPTEEIPDMYLPTLESCPMEAPVGEFIDRAKRLTGLLISRLDYFKSLQETIINATHEINKLVNECSSVNCRPNCVCIYCSDDEGNSWCCGCTCAGCIGEPCPYDAIREQIDIIIDARQEMISIVWEEFGEEEKTIEGIGIISIIREIIPTLLEDFKEHIWYPMRECVKDKTSNVFFDTQRVLGQVDPEGVMIRTPCYKEPTYEYCLEECYLEEPHLNIDDPEGTYRHCLEECLIDQAEQHGLSQIAWCRHLLNFYCCNVKWTPLIK